MHRAFNTTIAAGLTSLACLSGPIALADDMTIPAQSPAELRAALDDAVPHMLETHNVPSVAIAYLANGDVQWTANYGERAPGEPAEADTLYNVASITKAIVTEATLRLAADGHVNLDAQMADEFVDPDLANDERARILTPRMALSHRTGFARNWRDEMEDGKLAISYEPGTSASYSGENFVYLAHYLSAVFDKNIAELAEVELLGPLGMNNTYFTPGDDLNDRIAMVQPRNEDLRLPARAKTPSPADDVHITIGDLALFIEASMKGNGLTPELIAARGTIYENQVEAACPEGIIPADMCPVANGFGLGWIVYDSGDNRFLIHNGKGAGERAIALFEPEKQFGAIILTAGANGRSVISEVLQILVPDEKLNTLVAAEARYDQ